MHHTKYRFSAILILLLVGFCCTHAERSPANGQEAVSRVVEEFYSALNALFMGEIEPMMQIWSHADDVTYMGPTGGFNIGWQEISEAWSAPGCRWQRAESHDSRHELVPQGRRRLEDDRASHRPAASFAELAAR
jgi:hypothetical protein